MNQLGIFGILNLTADSFSDGGRYLDPGRAHAHAQQLLEDGADVIDVGAESTNPKGADVDAAEEIRRLELVVPELIAAGVAVSVDTRKAEVMAWAVGQGVPWLNDVHGFRDPEAVGIAAASEARLVCMFNRSADGRADDGDEGDPGAVVQECAQFFAERSAVFSGAGISRDRVIFDPGMGAFLGRREANSVAVLRAIPELAAEYELLISVSRKSFLGTLCGGRDVGDRGAATLAAELHGVRAGAHWIRTHEPRPLRDGLRVLQAIDKG